MARKFQDNFQRLGIPHFGELDLFSKKILIQEEQIELATQAAMKATSLEILKPEPPKNPMKDLFDVLFDTIFPIFLCTPRESRIRSMDPGD
jgi:hypothetical protein